MSHSNSSGAQHGLAAACREWSSAQDEMRKKMLGGLAQSLRDHAEASVTPARPEDWMEDEELVVGPCESLYWEVRIGKCVV